MKMTPHTENRRLPNMWDGSAQRKLPLGELLASKLNENLTILQHDIFEDEEVELVDEDPTEKAPECRGKIELFFAVRCICWLVAYLSLLKVPLPACAGYRFRLPTACSNTGAPPFRCWP